MYQVIPENMSSIIMKRVVVFLISFVVVMLSIQKLEGKSIGFSATGHTTNANTVDIHTNEVALSSINF